MLNRSDTTTGLRVILGFALLTVIVRALAAASGVSARADDGMIAQAAQTIPHVESVDCAAFKGLDITNATVQCGYLVVPENRSNPQSRPIKVAYAIIKAHGANLQPDPVVYLTGGPGDSAIREIEWWAGMPMSQSRDIILVDPRGVGYSQPAMACPAEPPPGANAREQAPGPEDVVAEQIQWAQACRDSLAGQGFDLTAYNSAASAADLDDLRRALGYAEWNLHGTSYGTRVALETMRAYPEGIRSAVLDSVLPSQVDRIGRGDLTATAGSLAALFTACKADAACDRDYPDLATKFNEIVQRLDRNPIRVPIQDSRGVTTQVWVRGATIVAGLKAMLMNPYLIQIAPIAIDRIHASDTTAIGRLYGNLASGDNQAVYHTVLCHDVGALFDPEQFHAELEKYPALKSFYAGDVQAAICQVWGAGQAAPAENQPVQSNIPTLLLTGSDYDSSTPPAYAQLAAATLPHSFLYEFPAYSHVVGDNECPETMIAGFLKDPARAPDASCMAQIKGLGFVTDVYRNPAAFYLFLAAQRSLPSWVLALIGLAGLLLFSAVIYVPIAYLRARGQGSRDAAANAARWTLWLAALLNIGFGAGVWLLARKALAENYGWVTLFGFAPSASRYLFILPWLTAILALALLAFVFLAWRRRWWRPAGRVYFTVTSLAAAGMTGLLVSWRLFQL